MDSQSQNPSSFPQACPICARQFDRAEHLRRHEATHTKERNRVCGLCGRTFGRKDALDRHQIVHRHHVPLRRFRACTRCAASRVKCSGVPCTRCRQKSLTCTVPDGSEAREGPSAGEGARVRLEIMQYTSPRSDEVHSNVPAASQQQNPAITTSLEQRTQPNNFMQQHVQPVSLTPQESNTYMISNLNWISPSMDFNDLAGFDYNQMAPNEPYWSSLADVNSLSDQTLSTSQIIRPISDRPLSTPGILQDPNDAETPGTSYVDNKGARQPRNGRYANRIFGDEASKEPSRTSSGFALMVPEPDGFNLLLTPVPDISGEFSTIWVEPFSPEQYYMMRQEFQHHCLAANGLVNDRPFVSTELPPISAFTTLLTLYRQRFDPKVLPMVHFELDNGMASCWLLKLAMAAIGSQYLDAGNTELTIALHEFLGRVLRQQVAIFSMERLTLESLGFVQSKLLNYIGLAYCGSKRLDGHRLLALESLVHDYRSLHKHHSALLQDTVGVQDRGDWVLSESVRRLCHAIWLLESMSRYHFDARSSLLLNFADIALPCKEDIWQAEGVDVQAPVKQPTLEKALKILYVEKRLVKNTGDFARILLINGLYCQTWDVGALLNRSLLRWTPSSRKGDAESHDLTGPAWLPQIPLYNQWRNAACDCLDVLHWIANSDIAKAGNENTTVLHLHFARIVLLAPYESVRRLAEMLVSEDIRDRDLAQMFRTECQQVQKWITEDQFKARLALVHCGIFFWHVRRYSLDAFYEPTKVFLVTLVVWAYGSLCPPQQPLQGSNGNTSYQPREDEDEDLSCDVDDISSIRLDRPCDDELVQLFIKRGRSMTATIMGVGNITSANGPLRMLKEGRKLLATLDRWPIRDRYLQTLTRLIDFCSQNTQWVQMGSSLEETPQPVPS